MQLARIAGHERVAEALRTAHRQGSLHHAHLFVGPAGVGKRRLALALAALVNCTGEAPTDAQGHPTDACGACRSCRRLAAVADREERADHPDLLRLETGPSERSIRIEPVREVLRIVPFPPLEAACRFVLIDPADAMTPEAANALLKTLEEPPGTTRFLLVSARPDALLPTVLSRCQRHDVGRLADAEVERILRAHHDLDDERAARLAALAEGSPGGALELLEDPVAVRRDEILRRLAAIPPGRAGPALELAGELAEERDALETTFELLQRLFRDLLLLRTVGPRAPGLSLPELHDEVLRPLAERWGVEALLHRLELIGETREEVARRNLNPRLSLERLLLALTAPAGRERAEPGVRR